MCRAVCLFFFFFNDTATTEIYTLSLHDALPISVRVRKTLCVLSRSRCTDSSRSARRPSCGSCPASRGSSGRTRSEEHTSELQSLAYLVCRLLLEKKKNTPPSRAHRRNPSALLWSSTSPISV